MPGQRSSRPDRGERNCGISTLAPLVCQIPVRTAGVDVWLDRNKSRIGEEPRPAARMRMPPGLGKTTTARRAAAVDVRGLRRRSDRRSATDASDDQDALRRVSLLEAPVGLLMAVGRMRGDISPELRPSLSLASTAHECLEVGCASWPEDYHSRSNVHLPLQIALVYPPLGVSTSLPSPSLTAPLP